MNKNQIRGRIIRTKGILVAAVALLFSLAQSGRAENTLQAYDDTVLQLAQADISSTKDVVSFEEKTLDLLTTIDAFTEEDARLRIDAAKAHYNMGNIYYKKGEYEIASREYYQAVTLMPDDPDSHYNLAFVSGEHLEDYKTALKHYQIYLYLAPNAPDANSVREKMIQAKLHIRGKIPQSPLENQERMY